jgi:hypothetical protein
MVWTTLPPLPFIVKSYVIWTLRSTGHRIPHASSEMTLAKPADDGS